jgi:hypothetical protein
MEETTKRAWRARERQGPLVETHNLEIGLNFEDNSDHHQRLHLDLANSTAVSVKTVS